MLSCTLRGTVSLGQRIDAANREAAARICASRPFWVDVAPLREVVADLGSREITHSGPPITFARMCGAQRGAAVAAVLFEGWADSPEEALSLLERGEVTLRPNHHAGGVGPMAGVCSPSMPVFVVEERAPGPRQGARAYACLEEPRMNFGAFDAPTLALRRYWRDSLGPILGAAVKHRGGLDLGRIIARALHRGDEMHNRPAAATSLMLGELVPAMLRGDVPREDLARAVEFVHDDEIFFLSLSMAASKLAADAARDVADSTLVVAMARNGTDFGIRVAGCGDQWFTAPSPVVEGLFLTGYGPDDAGRDMGDSAITETVGLGAFVLPGAMAILEMLGAKSADALRIGREMQRITVARHPTYTMPVFDFEGAPVGIDVRAVVETGVLPSIDTAIAHREAGHPILGAGLTRAPRQCFVDALVAFAAARGIQ